jgi:hypothetical protein
MLSRKICRPKVVVRSLFWMICKDSQIGNAFHGIGAKTLASRSSQAERRAWVGNWSGSDANVLRLFR